MKKQLCILLFILSSTNLFANDKKIFNLLKCNLKRIEMIGDTTPVDPPPNVPPKNDLSGFGNYNFGGGNTGFSTPQAEVNYGFKYPIGFTQKGYFEFRPSIATPVNAALSKNYIPALLLPGSASIDINTFFPIGKYIIWSPINVGLKFLSGFTDSAKTIIQHNLRTGVSFQIENFITIQAQYTWAWHNGTDESERNYNFVFNKNNSNIQYWTLTLQGKVSAKDATTPTYLIIQWRDLINPGQFPKLQNNRIFTIGFRASMNLSSGIHGIHSVM